MDRIADQRRRRLEIAEQYRRTTERLAANLDQSTADRVRAAIGEIDETMTVEEAIHRMEGVPKTVACGTGDYDQTESAAQRSANPFRKEVPE